MALPQGFAGLFREISWHRSALQLWGTGPLLTGRGLTGTHPSLLMWPCSRGKVAAENDHKWV